MRDRRAWAVVDLGFGDAGKGSITDWLVRTQGCQLVVRYNGGAQAGHNVVIPDGRHHTFAQFGAGSFVPGVATWLGPAFLLHPLGMLVEAEHLQRVGVRDIWQRTFVHPRVRVITPYQQAANRAREAHRAEHRHGSCGVGVGECVADSLAHDDTLRAHELAGSVRAKLRSQRDRKRAELEAMGAAVPEVFDDADLIRRVEEAWRAWAERIQLCETLPTASRVVFEGAQGVLLDEDWGFHPHTTWSDCTLAGAQALWDGPMHRLGVLRTYGVRHGPGPFPGELEPSIPDRHNAAGPWQGPVRTGAFDAVLLDYALQVCPVDSVALTHLDVVEEGPVVVELGGRTRLDPGRSGDLAYREQLGADLGEARIERRRIRDVVQAQIGVSVISVGPGAQDKKRVGELQEER